ncbi:hypothetical protein HGP16_21530 [Rhizobium sp. P40RR-XXII]|uniref:hypothetical protein n=1 Tax=unclassified Rhizobium TaxID=2613769 RepID=UPI0014569E91|nr:MULTISPECIES: hypothetical protein [unclassified Rhizobium]NLR87332.1 hypothetical protein [Rhizobium sp. P28RR-XV]NLS19119.1 hypothetical protein [Rhizobium sp. P40RR-XXII]
MSCGLRSLIALLDSVGHIGAAVRAAEEFEHARNFRKGDCRETGTARASASIPL